VSSADPTRRLRRALARSLRPPAVVLDVSFVNGLAACRSLHAAGACVIAVDHRPKALGLRSRAAVGVLSPDPADEQEYVAFLADLAERHFGEPAVVFPTHDAPLAAIGRNAERLAAYTLPGSGWDVVGPLQHKRHQYEAAARAGVATPRTAYPADRAEAERVAGELRYPALVKPSDPIPFKRRFGRPALVCDTPAALLDAFDAAVGSEPMLQEVVPGDDSSLWTVGTYTDANGRALGIFCGRKLLQMPRGFGTCRVGEARWRDDAVEQALALLDELGYRGIAQTEFRQDADDGELRLMEVNPRLWQWHGLARACGVDLPRIAYEDTLGRPPAPVRSGMAHDGRRWVAAAAHLRASHAEGAGFRAALAPFTGGDVIEATFDVRDPLPTLITASGLVTAPVLRGARRVVRRSGQ
jgi:D-aspartate ligase